MCGCMRSSFTPLALALALSAGCGDCNESTEVIAPTPTSEEGSAPPEAADETPAATPTEPAEPEGPIFGEPGETLEVELDADAIARIDAVIDALRHSPHEIRARVAAKRHGGGAFIAVLHTYNQGAEWIGRRRTEDGWDRIERRMARAKRECEADLAEARRSGVPLEEYFLNRDESPPPDCERMEQWAALPERLRDALDCERLHLVTVILDGEGTVQDQKDLGPIGTHRCFESFESAAVWDVDGDDKHDVVVDHTYLTGIGWGRGAIENFHRVRALDLFVSSAESPDTLVISKRTVTAYSLVEWATVGEYRFERSDGTVQVVVDRVTHSECYGEDIDEECDEHRERQSSLPWDAENHRFTREARPIRDEERP